MTVVPDSPVCQDCGRPATPEPDCPGVLGEVPVFRSMPDHYIGVDHPLACANCGRLEAACARRPCSAWRGGVT